MIKIQIVKRILDSTPKFYISHTGMKGKDSKGGKTISEAEFNNAETVLNKAGYAVTQLSGDNLEKLNQEQKHGWEILACIRATKDTFEMSDSVIFGRSFGNDDIASETLTEKEMQAMLNEAIG